MPDFQGEESKIPLEPPLPPAPPSRESSKGENTPPGSGDDLQHRLVELEKRLQQEKEKVLLANLRSQEEATYAAKVETAIKDVQEKLRRDRRDAEMEEGRLKLEAKVRELETRLVQERETWVATLKEQVKARESQDKEVETHFVGRIEEMERRWLDEKAHWQKLYMAKDEEIRNFKGQIEKLKSIEIEWQKALHEKRFYEEKAQQVAPLQGRLQVLEDKEKELFQVKAELLIAREQAQNLRSGSREREDRLLVENERLHQEVQSIAQRIRLETENEIKKLKNELNMAGSTILKMRAVAGALERQRSAFKARIDELAKSQAEVLELQQRWQENELRVRRETEAATRVRVKDEIRRELQDEWHQQEDKIRKEQEQVKKDIEEANAASTGRLEERIKILQDQTVSLEARLKDKNEELLATQEKLTQADLKKGQWDAEKQELQRQKQSAIDEYVAKQKEKQDSELQEARQALTRAEMDAGSLKKEMFMLGEKLADERKRLDQRIADERLLAEQKIAEERRELERKFDEERKEMERKIAEERKQLGVTFLEEQKELERTQQDWLQQKAELEKQVAGLKEQLENFSEVARQNMQAACQELQSRIQVLEDEINEYRKPKPGLLSKFIGGSESQPPQPPQPPKPPEPPQAPKL